jgi:hypothetical protein
MFSSGHGVLGFTNRDDSGPYTLLYSWIVMASIGYAGTMAGAFEWTFYTGGNVRGGETMECGVWDVTDSWHA